jgi:hypothetical protein
MTTFTMRRLLLITLVCCVATTSVMVLGFPRAMIALIHTSQVKSAGGWGKIYHMHELATADDRQVVKPNRDTLYSSVVIDLANGPVVINIPAYHRYWNVQFMDSSSNVFAYLGSRLTPGKQDSSALITPAGYHGETYGLDTIEATSKKIWLVYRFHVTDENDIATAVAVQNKLGITPIEAFSR